MGYYINGNVANQALYLQKGTGDINGDGYNDIILFTDLIAGSSNTYSVNFFVLFGSKNGFSTDIGNLDGTNGFTLTVSMLNTDSLSAPRYAYFIKDVNGDGIDELIVNSTVSPRKIYLIYGNKTWSATLDLRFVPEMILGSGNLGIVITPDVNYNRYTAFFGILGDINGDKKIDLAMSSENYKKVDPNLISGTVLKELDKVSLDGTNGFSITGLSAQKIKGIGDFNNDGYDDFFVLGSLRYSSGYFIATVLLVFGQSNFPSTFSIDDLNKPGFPKGLKMDYSHYSYSPYIDYSGFDVNGDGISDLIIRDLNLSYVNLYVVYGRDVPPSEFGFSFNLSQLNGTDGFIIHMGNMNILSIGDINRDGLNDFTMWISNVINVCIRK